MALFLQILEGETAASATPIIASSDPDIIAAVADALVDRIVGAGLSELCVVQEERAPGDRGAGGHADHGPHHHRSE